MIITKARTARGVFARALMFVGLAGLLLLGLPGAPQFAFAASETPKDQLDQRIHDYILAHPEVIMEALQSLDARQREEEAAAAKAVLSSRADEIFRDKQSPVVGNAAGDVTLVEFFDYNCPYCRQMAPLMTQVMKDDPQLKVVYKEFPILGPDSIFAAKAALASDKQGKYAVFHNALFSTRTRVTEQVVLKVAADTGLDVARLKTDMQQPDIQSSIDRNAELAQALRITGTPGFVVGDQIFPGATDLATMKKLIEQARALQK
ncbi:hypothetical protein AU467_34935 [Mesorhizobium loti]|uniref:Thioredoxin domain-containing protein n=1 Tax=Rhizobium loti TaxID=381 RepID=A0A117N4N5_RHILI|nr:hypothetical protein AU467_34935 [Mesorhizobium loti]